MDAALPPPSTLAKAESRPDPVLAWARKLRAGERDALGPWYQHEYRTVHRLCLGFLGSRSDADDLAQDAMLHLAEHLDRWDPKRAYAPWRNTLVVNLCRDHLRSQERRVRHEQGAAEARSERGHSQPERASELREVLERALRWLSPREREAFVLIDLEAFSASEAAEQLGLSTSTLRASLSLARRKLRDQLADWNPQGGPA